MEITRDVRQRPEAARPIVASRPASAAPAVTHAVPVTDPPTSEDPLGRALARAVRARAGDRAVSALLQRKAAQAKEEDNPTHALRGPATSRSSKADGEGGKKLDDKAMQERLLEELTSANGGLTVAIYVGDESGGEVKKEGKKLVNYGAAGEFRKQAYRFALAHGAFGLGPGNSLRADMATEMTASMGSQLKAITDAAKAVLKERWTKPVRVSTLAVFTHGWEAGIRVYVNEKEIAAAAKAAAAAAAAKAPKAPAAAGKAAGAPAPAPGAAAPAPAAKAPAAGANAPAAGAKAPAAAAKAPAGATDTPGYSNHAVLGLYESGQYSWIAAVARYLTDKPTVVLYACRSAGDVDAEARKAEAQDFQGWAGTETAMGGGMPLAGRMREGIEQAFVRREIAESRGVDLDTLDAAWLKEIAVATKEMEPDDPSPKSKKRKREDGPKLWGPSRQRWIYSLAIAEFARKTPGYDEALAKVRARSDIHVFSHLDRGNVVGNSRLAEFTADPSNPDNPAGARSSMMHMLAEGIIIEVLERDPKRRHVPGYTQDVYRSLVHSLGQTYIATLENWRHPTSWKSQIANLERASDRAIDALEAKAKPKPKPKGKRVDPAEQAAEAAKQAKLQVDKAAVRAKLKEDIAHVKSKPNTVDAKEVSKDEHAKEAAIRELAFIGIDATVKLLTRTQAPTVADLESVDLTPAAKTEILRGLRFFHTDVQMLISRKLAEPPAKARPEIAAP